MTLSEIQKTLKVPKGQYNSFGKYKFRSCEDILEAVKPLLKNATIIFNDEMILLGERYYIKTIATYKSEKEEISTAGFAREPLLQKGMNESQITGAASSYARKYALNALLAIDDTKDADFTNKHNQQPQPQQQKQSLVINSLRNLIGQYTDSFKNKEKIELVCKNLGIKNLTELKNKDDIIIKEMIAHIEKLIKGTKDGK
jgi:hypothetical protein